MTPKLRQIAVAGRHPIDDKRTKLSARVLLSGALLLLIVLVVTGFSFYWGRNLSVEVFVETIRSWGMWGILGSVALMMVHSFVPFPAEFLACANGMIYGPLWGTVITWTGAMLGAVIAFGLAQKLGRPFVERMVAKRNWEVLDDWAAINGWQVVLISRFIPVIAFNLINYAAGLTRLTWWQFIWTTGLGILPLTILMVVMGDNIESLGWESWLGLLIGGFILWLVFHRKLRERPKFRTSEDGS
jgi:uncharacterized membrane protein YdjX (TVP38/TMEM64 family)